MASRNPPTLEGRVWLQQFNGHLMHWVQSGLQDSASLTSMGDALEKLFQCCPDYASTVQSLALSASFLARQHRVKPTASRLATVGLTAGSVRADDTEDAARLGALQALYLAEIQLAQSCYFEGLDALRRVRLHLGKLSKEDHVAGYVRALAAQFEGRLYELGLEHVRAGDAFFESAEQTQSLMAGDFDGIATEIVTSVMGADGSMAPLVPQLRSLVTKEVTGLLVKARLGLARASVGNTADGTPENEAKDAATTAWATVDAHGLPDDLEVTDVFQAIGPLEPREATSRMNKLIRWAKEAHREQSNDWQALLHAANAHRKATAGDSGGAATLYQRAEKEAERASPLIAALVQGLALMDHGDGNPKLHDLLAEDFMAALAQLRRSGRSCSPPLRLKALLDEPVAAAVRWAFDRYTRFGSKDTRLSLGLLLDSLRQPRWLPLDLHANEQETFSLRRAVEIYQLMLDYLLRIAQALRTRASTVALILQGVGDQTLFLCVTGTDAAKAVVGHLAPPTYRAKARELARAAIDATAGKVDAAALQKAGRVLFNALPKPVQKLIRDHDTVLLAPDLRADEDSVPFELMYDGDAFLGLTKVITRLGSLRDLCRAVEPRRPGRGKMRALIACANQVPGRPQLDFAKQEQSELCAFLTERRWDAPLIDPSRLTQRFLLDRLKYVSVLHLAAHGEVFTGDEAVLLPGGERLVVDDLLRKRFPSVPFVYLNTCLLAHTRYLGGGASRGIAHTLFELGAPAVIANLSPVYDKVALDLAQAFYRYALEHPVGEALRHARCELATAGVAPAMWGTTILIGDPGHHITPPQDEHEPDDVIQVLDAYMNFDAEPDREARVRGITRIRATILKDPRNIPLRPAAALAMIEVLSKLDYSVPESDEECVERLIAIADELGHLPAMAVLRSVKANRRVEAETPETDTTAALDDAILMLDALREDAPAWENVRQKFLSAKKSIEMRSLGLERRFQGNWDEGSLDAANALLDALQATQADQESNDGTVALRPDEVALEDIAWNAIVIGYPHRFEDMREEAAYAGELVRKLIDRHFLPPAARESARPLLAGLLHDLWGRQHSVGLERELVQGWSGTLLQAIDDLSRNWAPPDAAPGFKIVSGFPGRLEEMLAFLDGCKWEEIYKHMDVRFDKLAEEAQSLLKTVGRDAPEALAGCYAWLLGSIVARNTFSPLEGSVPESIGERMDKLASALSIDGEGYLMRYLAEGFSAVRNAEFDELQRWKLNITPESYEELKKGMQGQHKSPRRDDSVDGR